jgi:endonuclease YncB( thermonuclease family)
VRQGRTYSNVLPYRQLQSRRRHPSYIVPLGTPILFAGLLGFALWSGALDASMWEQNDAVEPVSADSSEASDPHSRSFSICGAGPRINCVVDGDTFWLDGEKIRIANIDTPEIHPSRCAREEQLGQAAKQRLLELLNAGDFALQTGTRDVDIHGRQLRTVSRGASDFGETLISEGLARRWDGHRRPWCD